MKHLVATLMMAGTMAGPALAHDGVHIHPHATDPMWLPLLLVGAALVGGVMLKKALAK